MAVYQTDIAIIGAGPVGLFAVFQAGMLGFKSVVVDNLPHIGGQCTALYPEKPIYDVPGFPQIEAGHLIENLERQAAPFKPIYLLGQPTTSYTYDEEKQEFTLRTADNNEIKCKGILIAAGGGAFGPNRPPLEGIEALENKCVHYSVKSKMALKDKRVVIAGGGDSAVDWASILADIAKSVAVVHRREKFRAQEDSVRKMHALASQGKINLVIPYQLHQLQKNGEELQGVICRTLKGDEKELPCDVLLPFFGLRSDLSALKDWGVEIMDGGVQVDPLTMETKASKIYAIGDVARYPQKLKLILSGFSEAATALHSLRSQLFPDKVFHFEHSTTQGVPHI